jgi:hypothetical protein
MMQRATIVIGALLVLAVGALGWALVDTRSRVTDVEGRVAALQIRTAKLEGQHSADQVAMKRLSTQIQNVAIVATPSPFDPSTQDVAGQVSSLRSCLNDALTSIGLAYRAGNPPILLPCFGPT